MATYLELFDLKNNDALLHKLYVAVIKKAQLLLDAATPTAKQVTWANEALSNPQSVSIKIFYYVLAANSAASVATITAASDATIQTNVNAAADALIAGS